MTFITPLDKDVLLLLYILLTAAAATDTLACQSLLALNRCFSESATGLDNGCFSGWVTAVLASTQTLPPTINGNALSRDKGCLVGDQKSDQVAHLRGLSHGAPRLGQWMRGLYAAGDKSSIFFIIKTASLL